MIRAATHDDIPALLEMGRHFADVLKLDDGVGYDPDTMAHLFAHLIDDERGILIVMDGGAAGGLVHASMFNRHHLTGQELFYWIEPEHRGSGAGLKLIAALENGARAIGAQSWMMCTVEGLNVEGADRLYRRRGYRPCDRNYLKIFGD